MKSSYECLIDPVKRRKYDLKIKKVRLQERLRSTQAKAAAAFKHFGNSKKWKNESFNVEEKKQEKSKIV